jgi:O-acetyl-ADP-ribose deacetylase (regulator of RNase III)
VIRECTASALRVAEELGARSLALVAFGTGVGGFPVEEAAAIEVEEVRSFASSGARSLEHVVFCVRGAAAREAFERAAAA